MLKIVDLVYFSHNDTQDPQEVIKLHSHSLGYIDAIRQHANVTVVFHLNAKGSQLHNGIQYSWFRRSNAPWQIPIHTHQYIRSLEPDVVLVHGFIFPLQVIALKLAVKKDCRVMLQHHADEPAPSRRIILQRFADRFVAAYLFTSIELAKPWLEYKVISTEKKCFELLGASTSIQRREKRKCRNRLGIAGKDIFLWVGRLNTNKDPLKVLRGFGKYLETNGEAHLYMIYQTDELLKEVNDLIQSNQQLLSNVHLVGKIEEDIADWYSAADVFISGSHAESTGYALVEALHCGCIPVVTSIPSFIKVTENGKYGFLYKAGNESDLCRVLLGLQWDKQEELSSQVQSYAINNLSYRNIAEQFLSLCKRLTGKIHS